MPGTGDCTTTANHNPQPTAHNPHPTTINHPTVQPSNHPTVPTIPPRNVPSEELMGSSPLSLSGVSMFNRSPKPAELPGGDVWRACKRPSRRPSSRPPSSSNLSGVLAGHATKRVRAACNRGGRTGRCGVQPRHHFSVKRAYPVRSMMSLSLTSLTRAGDESVRLARFSLRLPLGDRRSRRPRAPLTSASAPPAWPPLMLPMIHLACHAARRDGATSAIAKALATIAASIAARAAPSTATVEHDGPSGNH